MINLKQYVNDLNTTNYRIFDSVWLANFVVILTAIGVTILHWEPTAMQLKVLTGIGGGILTMMGFDVFQFWAKRSTDTALAAAKNPNVAVVVEKPPESPAVLRPAAPDPELAHALQIGADRDAQLAAGTLQTREE